MERDLELQHLGNIGCPLEVLLGRGCLAGAELEQERSLPWAEVGQAGRGRAFGWGVTHCFLLSFLGGASATERLKELRQKLSRSKQQPLQAASTLELEMLRQQVTGPGPPPGEARAVSLSRRAPAPRSRASGEPHCWAGIEGHLSMQLQETERRGQALQASVAEQKAESRSLQEQLTKQTALLGLLQGHFRQARLQLKHQATAVSEPRGPMAGQLPGPSRTSKATQH